MEYEMIPDTLPHRTQSSITTVRAFFSAGSDSSRGRPATHPATEIPGVVLSYLFRKTTRGSDVSRNQARWANSTEDFMIEIQKQTTERGTIKIMVPDTIISSPLPPPLNKENNYDGSSRTLADFAAHLDPFVGVYVL
jgi:hypothetical protein